MDNQDKKPMTPEELEAERKRWHHGPKMSESKVLQAIDAEMSDPNYKPNPSLACLWSHNMMLRKEIARVEAENQEVLDRLRAAATQKSLPPRGAWIEI